MQMQLSLHVQHKYSHRSLYAHWHTNSSCFHRNKQSQNMMCLYYCLELLWHADVTRMCLWLMCIALLHKLCYITVQWTAGLRNAHTHCIKNTQFKKACTQHIHVHTSKLKPHYQALASVCVFVFAFYTVMMWLQKKQYDFWFLCPDADETHKLF